MRILVTGSRSWTDREAIFRALLATGVKGFPNDDYQRVLVSGGCPTGADALAESVAQRMSWTVERHPANWGAHGRAAGFRRNAEMVALGADVCLAFLMPCSKRGCTEPQPHSSHGAGGCAQLAMRAGIDTITHKPSH